MSTSPLRLPPTIPTVASDITYISHFTSFVVASFVIISCTPAFVSVTLYTAPVISCTSKVNDESEFVIIKFSFRHVGVIHMKYSSCLSIQIIYSYSVAVHCVWSSVDGNINSFNIWKYILFTILAVRDVFVSEKNYNCSHIFSWNIDGFNHNRLVFSPVSRSNVADVLKMVFRVRVFPRSLGVCF